ncbi:hypothetical protein [Pedobacter rhodius]|uniref:Uncharacterized protein n=1 Tax=Pedobacter rhodius TaxID=3004098 RepID=A0ABT4KXJ7_9SPHI|nr:hypothetical protein [Pedobacter sp. SJ11]MCZ4223495.1 hypothetical protein [Pedobacter sp. SJ11]
MNKDNFNIMQPNSHSVSERFEYTCPLLLSTEHQLNPYLEIESFFNGASLGFYRFELRSWFKIAMTPDLTVENHSNTIYFHNQLIQLLHAGYLIVENNIKYASKTRYSENTESFKDWVNDMRKEKIDEGIGAASSYEVNSLSETEMENPFLYLKKILTFSRISEIRYGLQEWIYCSFNDNSSIATMDAEHVFGLFEDIEKLLELLFHLLVGDEN